jgi:hypothetical protein
VVRAGGRPSSGPGSAPGVLWRAGRSGRRRGRLASGEHTGRAGGELPGRAAGAGEAGGGDGWPGRAARAGGERGRPSDWGGGAA